ncbi:sulfotransferase [Roseivirga sp. BDSF3-8]|uniref:sulfotransferase family protein n=1 Tax=Roseivirga sp. BDSF3-8 TaxID=3241598 RepID=UPI00353245DE
MSQILSDKQMVFIIGSPRSGTTWLQKILGNHPSVGTAESEITLVHKYLRPLHDAWTQEKGTNAMGIPHGLPAVWNDGEFNAFTADFIDRVYQKVLDVESNNVTHVVEKYPQNAFDVHFIKELFPNAKLIHLIRDGRKVALSLVNVRKTAGFGSDSLPRAIKYWKKSIKAAREGRKYTGDFFEIRYEDLLEDGEKHLPTVLDFCGLPHTERQVREWVEANSIRNKPVSFPTSGDTVKEDLKKEYSPTEKLIFNKIAGDMLVELNYAGPDWWHEGAASKYSHQFRWFVKSLSNRLKRVVADK